METISRVLFVLCLCAIDSVANAESVKGARLGTAIYSGDVVDGKPHGRGVAIMADGAKYDGEWVAGLPEGQGSLLVHVSPPLDGVRWDAPTPAPRSYEARGEGYPLHRGDDGHVPNRVYTG